MYENIENLKLLGNAIVLQAIADYEEAIAVLLTMYNPKTEKQEKKVKCKKFHAKNAKYDCEAFFRSAWYRTLSPVDSEHLMSTILDGVKNAKKVTYNEEKERYTCSCGYPLPVNVNNIHNEYGLPVVKCKNCKKYWRAFGNPIDIEQ